MELYYQIPETEYDKLITCYTQNIEIVYTSKREHFSDYFGGI